MRLNQQNIKIPDCAKSSPRRLFLFIFFNMFLKAILKTISFRIYFIILLLLIFGQSIPLIKQISPSLSLLTSIFVFLFVCMPLYVTLEEFFHAATCIQKGRSEYIEELQLIYLVRGNTRIIWLGATIKLRGKFSSLDLIHILAGGPFTIALLLLFFSGVVITLGYFFGLSDTNVTSYILVGFIFPLSSLAPYGFIIETDGAKILKLTKKNKYSFKVLVLQAFYSSYLVFTYLFGMKRQKRQYTYDLIAEYHNRAYEYAKDGKIKDAVKELEKAYSIDPENKDTCNNLAFCYLELDTELKKALSLSKKATKLAPTDVDYLDTLATAYQKNGEFDKAKEIFQNMRCNE